MANSMSPIASAVIVPEATNPKLSPPSSKRRQSSASQEDNASKRSRLSHDGSPHSPTTDSPADTVPSRETKKERPRASILDEKKRGQRLFGGLLSTLSQSTPNGQQKRRQDFEKRQAEKAQAQKAQDEVRRRERLASIKVVRRAEQVKWDEQSMKVRHESIRAKARFLCTKAEPKLYYIPWELRSEEIAGIKQQTAESEALIEKELVEFRERHPTSTRHEADSNAVKPEIGAERHRTEPENEEAEPTADSTSNEMMGEPSNELPPLATNDETTITTTNERQEDAKPEVDVEAELGASDETTDLAEEQSGHAHGEHNGEVVMENEEDTVIY